MPWLIAGRCGQGVGGTLLLSGALGVLESDRGRRLGHATWSLAATVGLAVGPALGGVLTEAFDWRAISLAPVAVAALVVGAGRSTHASTALADPADEREVRPAAAWLADGALAAGLDPVRTGARTVAARHAGLVLGLLVIAPALATDLGTGAERAVLAGAETHARRPAARPGQDRCGARRRRGRRRHTKGPHARRRRRLRGGRRQRR